MAPSGNDVSALILAAFNETDCSFPEIRRSWITVSVRIGGRLGNSLLGPAVQRDGSLDRILRGIERASRSTANYQARGRLVRMPPNGNASDYYEYSSSDSTKAHIGNG